MPNKIIVILAFFIIHYPLSIIHFANGQTPEQSLTAGIEYEKKGQFGPADAQYQTATRSGQGDVAARGLLLSALANFKNGKTTAGEAQLNKLLNQNPAYAAQAQARLHGLGYLLVGRRFASASRLAQTASPEEADALQKVMAEGAIKAPADTLVALIRKYPNQKGLAWATYQVTKNDARPAIAAQARIIAEANGFPTNGPSTINKTIGRPIIGLFLPLTQQKAQAKEVNTVAEFMAGAQLAAEDLAAQNKAINLLTFDTEQSETKLNTLLVQPGMNNLNLALGAVYSQETTLLAAWAQRERVPMLSILSNQPRWDANNPQAFQSEPGFADYAQAALRVFPQAKKVVVFYGTTVRDTGTAAAFKQAAAAAGLPVTGYRKVGQNSAANLAKFMAESGVDSTTLLFIPNTNRMVRAQMLTTLKLSSSKARVVAWGDVLEEAEQSLDTWEPAGVYFLYPGYLPYEGASEKVRQRIAERTGLPATEYGLKGYEAIWVLGSNLTTEGNSPDFLRARSPFRGLLTPGFDFSTGLTNSQVAIYRLRGGKLVVE